MEARGPEIHDYPLTSKRAQGQLRYIKRKKRKKGKEKKNRKGYSGLARQNKNSKPPADTGRETT